MENDMEKHVQVAVYYFPNFHPDARMEKIHGKGWSEWELVRHAVSRFPDRTSQGAFLVI